MSERELSVCEVCGWGNMRGEPMSCFKPDCPNPRERSAPTPARGDVEALKSDVADLLIQATRERSHYYTASVLRRVAALLAALASERAPDGWCIEIRFRKEDDWSALLGEFHPAKERATEVMDRRAKNNPQYDFRVAPFYIGTPLTPESDDGE